MSASDAPEPSRYTIRRDAFGWSVIDTHTGRVAERNNVTLTGLGAEEADDAANALSWHHAKAHGRSGHGT
jgi:hypothetical protein